ncbi:MAG: FkbM family methyltransferase [Ahrensia sp.]|nr:FkbM family methyltransferase [Ahrensia sp.]
MPRRPLRELDEFCTYLSSRHFTPKTVIDVGACYGTPELLQGFPDAYHILYEPVPTLEDRMKQIVAKYRGEYHMIALADQVGEMPFVIPQNAVQAATLTVTDQNADQAVQIPVDTLDNQMSGRDLEGPIMLKTDCQGYDLQIMKGGIEFLKRVDVVVMEVNMFHPGGKFDLPDFGEIVCWMREHNFAVYDIISYQIRPFDDALGYVDLVFAPEDGELRKHHRWA